MFAFALIFTLVFSSGDRTRTYDLRVMSPTSYQLLHPAIYLYVILSNFGAIALRFPYPNGLQIYGLFIEFKTFKKINLQIILKNQQFKGLTLGKSL